MLEHHSPISTPIITAKTVTETAMRGTPVFTNVIRSPESVGPVTEHKHKMSIITILIHVQMLIIVSNYCYAPVVFLLALL